MDTKRHLCNSCIKNFAECDGNPKFGDGVGNDNVYDCDGYVELKPYVHKGERGTVTYDGTRATISGTVTEDDLGAATRGFHAKYGADSSK